MHRTRHFAAFVNCAGFLPLAAAIVLVAGCGVKDDIDLTFNRGLRWDPEPPTSLVPLTLSFDVVNDSSVGVDNVEWVINRDGAPFRSGAFVSIGRADYEFGSVTFTETGGVHVYEFIIDPANRINERDERDNASVIRVTVPPGGTG